MMAKPEFKVDIDNTLKAHFADGLKDHYHQAIVREMICFVPNSQLHCLQVGGSENFRTKCQTT